MKSLWRQIHHVLPIWTSLQQQVADEVCQRGALKSGTNVATPVAVHAACRALLIFPASIQSSSKDKGLEPLK
jgi:hypothetical protein